MGIVAQGNIIFMQAFTVTFDPASVPAASTAEQDITVPGVKTGDIVLAVNKPSHTSGLVIGNIRAKAANTVSVQFINPTAGAIDAASESYLFVIARPEATPTAFNP